MPPRYLPSALALAMPSSLPRQHNASFKLGDRSDDLKHKFAGRIVRVEISYFAIRNQLLSGSHDSIEAMSGRLGMNKGRLTSLVRLSYLGPEIVRALLAGSQSNALTPSRLLRLSKNLPHHWTEQRCFLGFAA